MSRYHQAVRASLSEAEIKTKSRIKICQANTRQFETHHRKDIQFRMKNSKIHYLVHSKC